jgi:hypothetical protein
MNCVLASTAKLRSSLWPISFLSASLLPPFDVDGERRVVARVGHHPAVEDEERVAAPRCDRRGAGGQEC